MAPNRQDGKATATSAVTRASLAASRHGVSVTRAFGDRIDGDDMAFAFDDAFGVSVQLRPLAAHRLWHGRSVVSEGPLERGALAITDLREPWRFEPLAAFDHVDLRVPFASLNDVEADGGRSDYIGLTCEPGALDEVMLGLVRALLPSLDRPDRANRLFVDQINLAMITHLRHAYSGGRVWAQRKGTLAKWQERRALDYLAAHLHAPISIADLAVACDLSRSYFIRAFKETLGETPHRWLTGHRVDKAKELLRQELPIAEIALMCGFADQSHLNKVFLAMVGLTPGQFRRSARTGAND